MHQPRRLGHFTICNVSYSAEGYTKTLARMDPKVANAAGVKMVPGKITNVPGVQVSRSELVLPYLMKKHFLNIMYWYVAS